MISDLSMANAIRFLAIDAVEKAKSGHPGMPMGMADVATVLFKDFLKFDPQNPTWPDRDRFVLSAGHGSMLLYALLYLTGYSHMTLEQLKNFRQWESLTAGHPESHVLGIETTTGPLGQGIATAVGMALAESMLRHAFSTNLVDHKTYVIASDGDLMEGISHEAASLAGHLKLNKLIVLYDDNGISIDGPTDLSFSDNTLKRFEAYHWNVITIDGHHHGQIKDALHRAQTSDKPTLIACRTTIAFGAPTKAGTSASHGSPLGEDEVAKTRETLNWPYAPFEIPDDILKAWRSLGAKANSAAWHERLTRDPQSAEFQRRLQKDLPSTWKSEINALKQTWVEGPKSAATRQLSQLVIDTIAPHLPELIGGSADLTGSNNTKAKTQTPLSAQDYSGRYIYYGVREHAMAAMMNGLYGHGGFIPYGGTFLVFADYLKPALRLSALMERPVIYVLTHDSIGLGEDGPTHQPIEHLASLRAIPNVNVFRPADGIEVAECWELAIEDTKTPSVLALTRQNITPARQDIQENLCAKGGYVLREAQGPRQATLIATGSEVGIALEAYAQLTEQGIHVAVVSLPCWRLFDQQAPEYRKSVLGDGLRVGIEAACGFGWEKYLGDQGVFIGMKGFGASAPYQKLYEAFGITTSHVVSAVKERLSK